MLYMASTVLGRALVVVLLSTLGSVANAGLDEDVLGLAALKGKVVYVDFWASWCVPCRESFPWMSGLQRRFATDGLVIIGVNVDHERADADLFLNRYMPEFRVSFDPAGRLAEQFKVQGMPTSFLIDRNGQIRLRHAGFRLKDRSSLEQQIQALLSSKS